LSSHHPSVLLQAVTSLDLSPQGQFLAVSMIGEPGVFIWSNRTLYMHVPLKGRATCLVYVM